jgi:hypothetical protein
MTAFPTSAGYRDAGHTDARQVCVRYALTDVARVAHSKDEDDEVEPGRWLCWWAILGLNL